MNNNFDENKNIKGIIKTKNNHKCFNQIKEHFKELCSVCQQGYFQTDEYFFEVVKLRKEFYKKITEKTQSFKLEELVMPTIKFLKCVTANNLPRYASATKHHIYNASKIPVGNKFCIAARGPDLKTFENFFALLGENKATISVSLVHNEEFAYEFNKRLRSLILYPEQVYTIQPIEDFNNNLIRKKYNIQLIDFYVDPDANLEYELFLINDSYHFRIYNTNWKENKTSNLNRIIALIIFIRRIQKINVLNSTDFPIVVNCNSGVGRSGTFISLLNVIESYLNNQQIIEPDKFILNARQYRSCFVFTSSQYGMIKYLSINPEIIDGIYVQVIAKRLLMVK